MRLAEVKADPASVSSEAVSAAEDYELALKAVKGAEGQIKQWTAESAVSKTQELADLAHQIEGLSNQVTGKDVKKVLTELRTRQAQQRLAIDKMPSPLEFVGTS